MCLPLSRNETTFTTTFNRRDGTRHTRDVQSPKTRSRARCKGERRGFHPFGPDEIRFTRCLEILRPPDTFSRCMPLISWFTLPAFSHPCIDPTLLKTIVAYRMIKRKKFLNRRSNLEEDLLIWSTTKGIKMLVVVGDLLILYYLIGIKIIVFHHFFSKRLIRNCLYFL